MAQLINGKEIAATIRSEIAAETAALKEQGITPGLAVILVGDNPASQTYVRNKQKACEEVGFYGEQINLPATTTQEELLAVVEKLNNRKDIHGILCQLPLPKGLDDGAVIAAIDPKKDVDAFHAENVGHIMIGDQHFLPCTPAGVMELIHRSGISVEGKHCVVIGRSNIVGKPMAMLLLQENGTVTICHSRTKDLAAICRQADILVAAVGRAKFVTADMVKEGATVIDVGINRDENGKLCGDVDFATVEPIAGKGRLYGACTPLFSSTAAVLVTTLVIPHELLTRLTGLAGALLLPIQYASNAMRVLTLSLLMLTFFLAIGASAQAGASTLMSCAKEAPGWLPGALVAGMFLTQAADASVLWSLLGIVEPWLLLPLAVLTVVCIPIALYRRKCT